jgi:hypothetical protein
MTRRVSFRRDNDTAPQVEAMTIPGWQELIKCSEDELKTLSQHYGLAYVNVATARSALNNQRKANANG